MSAKKKFKVRRGNSHVSVFPWRHAVTGREYWRFGWKDGGRWRYLVRRTKEEAEEEAWKVLGDQAAGALVWSGLAKAERGFLEKVHAETGPADWAAVLEFIAARKKSGEIVASVARFLDHKRAQAGEETRHLGNVRRDLEAMAAAFAGRVVVDISAADLRGWWDGRVTRPDGSRLSDKTRNEVRGNLVAFWNWCVWDGIHAKTVTAAEKLPRVELGLCERRVLTPGEFLALAEAIGEEWRPWLVLGAFCGLRPEEIAPPRKRGASKKGKRGLLREEIDWRFRVLRLPAEVSKVAAPRHVPLGEAALAWLAWAGVEDGQTGPVCLRNPSEESETARLGRVVFGDGWPQDALRHTYGSMRNAEIRNLPQVAEEMGTSETMLRRHYHNPRTSEEGAAWFAMRPTVIRNDSKDRGLNKVAEEVRRARKA